MRGLYNGYFSFFQFLEFGSFIMRNLKYVLAVVAVLMSASFVSAAEPGQVSNDALAAVGLSGMQTMSDAEGTEIRGQAALAFGYSSSSIVVFTPGVITNAGGTGGYVAFYPNLAAGASFAFANSSISPFVYAGGASIAGGF